MADAYVIRRLLPQEWQAYRAIRLRALEDAPDAFCATLAEAQAWDIGEWAARLERAAASGIDCPLVAEQDGAPVGMLWAKADGDHPDRVNLFQVWVAPESRGRGVASRLLDEGLAWARARGARAVHLGVNRANAHVIRLYERAGFEAIGAPRPMREGCSNMEQQMRLLLAAGE